MRPGDRKERWKESCNGSGMIFLAGAFILIIGVQGQAVFILVMALLAGAFLEFRDGKRGWKISYKLPPSYYRDIESPNKMTREIAKDSGEAVMRQAKDPNRKRYAFEKRRRDK